MPDSSTGVSDRATLFCDYIVYVDESGDHGLKSIDLSYPIFVLAFCIFKKSDYVSMVVPALQAFKFRWFGHDLVVLHEHEIVKKKGQFAFLQFDGLRERFHRELNEIVASAPMTVVASIIKKDALRQRYASPENPYQLALLFCLERTRAYLVSKNAQDGTAHVVFESRSPRQKGGVGKEDAELELEFRRIVAGRHRLQNADGSAAMPKFDIVFCSKGANSSGVQIADLIARPIGLNVLRPGQENRAYEIIRKKFWRGEPTGDVFFDTNLVNPIGLKVFP